MVKRFTMTLAIGAADADRAQTRLRESGFEVSLSPEAEGARKLLTISAPWEETAPDADEQRRYLAEAEGALTALGIAWTHVSQGVSFGSASTKWLEVYSGADMEPTGIKILVDSASEAAIDRELERVAQGLGLQRDDLTVLPEPRRS